jgi:DNA-binding GntR family transcriptional regulator
MPLQELGAPIEHRTLVDSVFDRIEAAIITGTLKPGESLSEAELSRKMGISRSVIREAIGRLEGRKLIQRIPRIGARVAEVSLADVADVFELREALEGFACRLAAERMTDDDIAALDSLLDRHEAGEDVKEGTAYYQNAGNLDFHYAIVQGSGNKRLIYLLCNELYHTLRLYRYKSSTVEGRPADALAEHRAVVAALKARDGTRAEALMRRHIANSRKAFACQEEEEHEGKAKKS